ncbi:hypothetical protein ABZ297_05210 [Nonomuraea sp. NPDC005983]|uniref:hypothetical protein n=1 Tax=Nonomuraea sp. NPDC005983 TaxID=3155595 RepID=UPI0033A2C785
MSLSSGADAAERWLLVAFTVVRAAAAVMVAATALSGESRDWLMVVAVVESAVLTGLSWRAGRVPPSWAVFAEGALLAAMALAVLVRTARPHTWDNWPFDYAVPFVIGIGLSGGRWRVTLPALAPVLAVVAAASPMTGEPLGYASFDLATLTVNTAVGTLVARAVRRRGGEADAARQEAVTTEAAAAAARERAAHARVIHDQVLQTLELLGHQGQVPEPALREQVRAEAGRLRALIGSGGGAAVDEGMAAVVEHARGLGVSAELTLPDGLAVPQEIVTAVRDYLTALPVRGRVVIFVEPVEAAAGTVLVTITHAGPPARGWEHPRVESEVLFTPGEGSEVELRAARQ